MPVFLFCVILVMISVVGALILPSMMIDLSESAYRRQPLAKRKEMMLREMSRRLSDAPDSRARDFEFGERFLRSRTNEALLRENSDIDDEANRESAAAEKMLKVVSEAS